VKSRPVTRLGHQEGRRVFRVEPKFFELCPIFLNYVQHIFPGGGIYLRVFRPPAHPLVTGLLKRQRKWHSFLKKKLYNCLGGQLLKITPLLICHWLKKFFKKRWLEILHKTTEFNSTSVTIRISYLHKNMKVQQILSNLEKAQNPLTGKQKGYLNLLKLQN